MVTKWISDFQSNNKEPDEDVVFDVLCGDFNFDNCSPGELLPEPFTETMFTKSFLFKL